MRARGGWKDLAAEVVIVGLRQQLHQRLAIEQVDAHAGQAVAAAALDAVGVDPGRLHPHDVDFLVGLRLLEKARHAARIVDAHQAHAAGRLAIDRHAGDRDVGLGLADAWPSSRRKSIR